MARLLVVEDEPTFRAFLCDVLEGAGHEVLAAADGREGLEAAASGPLDLVITDQRMPRMTGLELVRHLRAIPAAPPVVVITAYGTIREAVEAVRLGAADYITKPLESPGAFLAVVERLLGGGGEADEELVTADPELRRTIGLVDRIAGRDVAVLIDGESGTGKELVARRVHARSRRAAGPFVALNCAALPESLAESELFGHERGAFTGADSQRRGRFEEASGGTLFLDEIGELQPALQGKLLRVLEERSVRRVGGSRDVAVDVRLIAATNRDLEAAVGEGAFRRDLYFRIAVVPVHLPPLRDRPGDVGVLARHFLARLAARHGVPAPVLPAEALAALERYGWPGNVRELRNVLERAVVIGAGREIDERSLMLPVEGAAAGAAHLDRDARERAAIREALRRAGGNRGKAASLLGISVRTLYYRLRKWQIS